MASEPIYLYVARFLLGFGGGGAFTVGPMYITEIADTTLVHSRLEI